jgi:hypothetical protein
MAGPQGQLCHWLMAAETITRLAGRRAGDLTLRELPLQGKVQKRIVRAAAREMPEVVAASGSTDTWCRILPK